MNRFSRHLGGVFAVLMLISAQTALATTVKQLTLQDLAKGSESIVMARVEDASSRWDSGHKEIYTFYTLRALDHIKGTKGQTVITLRQLGGTVDNISSIVPGMPEFKKGEEVILFLTQKDAAGYPWVMGLQQGKYTISTDAKGNKNVRSDLVGTTLIDKNGTHVEAKVGSPMPLTDFIGTIKSTLGDDSGQMKVDPNPVE